MSQSLSFYIFLETRQYFLNGESTLYNLDRGLAKPTLICAWNNVLTTSLTATLPAPWESQVMDISTVRVAASRAFRSLWVLLCAFQIPLPTHTHTVAQKRFQVSRTLLVVPNTWKLVYRSVLFDQEANAIDFSIF